MRFKANSETFLIEAFFPMEAIFKCHYNLKLDKQFKLNSGTGFVFKSEIYGVQIIDGLISIK